MNSERRFDYGKLLAIGVIALLGLTLMGGALFAPKTVSGALRVRDPGDRHQPQLRLRAARAAALRRQWRVEQLPFGESPPASQ